MEKNLLSSMSITNNEDQTQTIKSLKVDGTRPEKEINREKVCRLVTVVIAITGGHKRPRVLNLGCL